MDIAGLGFSIVAEARTITQSIVRRVEKLPTGPKSVRRLERHSRSFGGQHRKKSTSLSEVFHMRFRKTYAPCSGTFWKRVRDTLRKADGTLEQELSKAFGGSGGGIVKRSEMEGV